MLNNVDIFTWHRVYSRRHITQNDTQQNDSTPTDAQHFISLYRSCVDKSSFSLQLWNGSNKLEYLSPVCL